MEEVAFDFLDEFELSILNGMLLLVMSVLIDGARSSTEYNMIVSRICHMCGILYSVDGFRDFL